MFGAGSSSSNPSSSSVSGSIFDMVASVSIVCSEFVPARLTLPNQGDLTKGLPRNACVLVLSVVCPAFKGLNKGITIPSELRPASHVLSKSDGFSHVGEARGEESAGGD